MESFGADEDGERLKAWLRANGSYVLYALIVGLGLAFGIRYWRGHEEQVRVASASIYGDTLGWYQRGDRAAVQVATRKLERHYGGTPYAVLAALLDAKMAYQAKDLKQAGAALAWAVHHARQPGVGAIARIRWSRLLLEEHRLPAALAALKGPSPPGFSAPYNEARGDILVAQGHPAAARTAYEAALAHVSRTSRDAGILQMKVDDLKSAAA